MTNIYMALSSTVITEVLLKLIILMNKIIKIQDFSMVPHKYEMVCNLMVG